MKTEGEDEYKVRWHNAGEIIAHADEVLDGAPCEDETECMISKRGADHICL